MEVPIMSSPVRRRHHRSREEIAALLFEFDRSGQSASAFAHGRGLAVSTLQAWRRRRGQAPSGPGAALPRLLPVTVGMEPLRAGPVLLEVLLVGGRVLRFPPGLAAEELTAVCEALERPCLR